MQENFDLNKSEQQKVLSTEFLGYAPAAGFSNLSISTIEHNYSGKVWDPESESMAGTVNYF